MDELDKAKNKCIKVILNSLELLSVPKSIYDKIRQIVLREINDYHRAALGENNDKKRD